MTLLLGKLCLIFLRKLVPNFLDLHAFFCSKLLAEHLLHLLVNVMCRLRVVHNLLLLHLDLHTAKLLVELSIFRLLNDFALMLNLLLQAHDLLPENALSLVSFELILLA